MRIAAVFMPFLALLAGGAGYYLRMTELWNVFDARTGLPERGAGVTLALIAFSAVFILIALLFSIRVAVKRKALRGFENAFGTDPLTYPFTFAIIGLAWLVATVMHFIDVRESGYLPLAELYFIILSALSALSVAFFAIEMFQDPRRKSTFALSVIPTLFMCFWLILMYRQNASNPVLLSYAYQCLAIIASALALYFTSGFVYDKPAPGKTIFAYFSAIFFCFITLADDHTLSIRIIFSSIIAMNVIYSSKLLRNLRRK